MIENRRCRADSDKLVLLMKSKGLTRAALASQAKANGESVHPRTISRAINGNSIEAEKLRVICEVLDVPIAELLDHAAADQGANTDPLRFVGKWWGRFVEMRLIKGVRVVNETIEVRMSHGELIAEFAPRKPGDTDTETVKWVRAIGTNFIGESWVNEWPAPFGVGLFQLRLFNGDQLMDGVTSWADPDTETVEWSRYVWVREGCDDDDVKKYADTLVDQELEQYQRRIAYRLGLKDIIS